MQITDLEHMREWASQRIGSQEETPWDWYQLMKLRESLDALIKSANATATQRTEDLPERASHSGTPLRLVASDNRQDSAPHRQ